MSVISVKSQDLSVLVNDKKTFLVDVRTPEEFAEGNVEGSVNIPIQILQEHLAQFQGKKNIVVFCRSGNRSKKSIEILKANGIENAVDGGTWQNVKSLQKKAKNQQKITKRNHVPEISRINFLRKACIDRLFRYLVSAV